jgi:hypothetical protein
MALFWVTMSKGTVMQTSPEFRESVTERIYIHAETGLRIKVLCKQEQIPVRQVGERDARYIDGPVTLETEAGDPCEQIDPTGDVLICCTQRGLRVTLTGT